MGRNLDTVDVRGLLGLLFADGSLTYHHGPTRDHVRATLNAGAGERDFLEEKVAEVREFIPTQARIIPYQTRERDSGNRTTVLRFRFTSGKLKPIYNLLYPSGEREITRPVLELLGGRAAAWLWAEGARIRSNGATLRRVGNLTDEARLISGWLQLITGAESEVTTDQIRPRLFFHPRQAQILQGALLPYAPTSRRHLFQVE